MNFNNIFYLNQYIQIWSFEVVINRNTIETYCRPCLILSLQIPAYILPLKHVWFQISQLQLLESYVSCMVWRKPVHHCRKFCWTAQSRPGLGSPSRWKENVSVHFLLTRREWWSTFLYLSRKHSLIQSGKRAKGDLLLVGVFETSSFFTVAQIQVYSPTHFYTCLHPCDLPRSRCWHFQHPQRFPRDSSCQYHIPELSSILTFTITD